MGAVIIKRSQRDELPDLCMRCGEHATTRCGKTFSKAQGWVSAVAIFGIPWLLCAILFRNYMHVRVPLCDSHKHHFTWQSLIFWGGMGIVGSMLAISFSLIFQGVDDYYVSRCFGASGVAGLLWAGAYLINSLFGIVAGTVDDNQALIVGVSDRFARAVERHAELAEV